MVSTALASVCLPPSAAGIRSKAIFPFSLFFCCRLHLDKTRVVRHQSPEPLFISSSAIIAPLCAALPGFQVQRPNCCSLRLKRASEPLLFSSFPLKRSASGVAINAALHSRPNNTIRGGRARSEPIRSEQRLAAGARRRSHGGPCCHGY